MGRIFPQLIRLFLAATIVVGGIFVHMGSAAHATSSFGVSHAHSGHSEKSDVTNLAKSDESVPSHALGFCIDAHCCTPAVHMAPQNGLRQSLERGRLVIAASPDYALSITDSLLRPPRAIV